MPRKITIGSRGSDLALWQAQHVQALLSGIGIEAEIKVIKTQGDKIQNIGFDKMEGKGFFTKEIEAALLDGSIDLAVHSHKDLETVNPTGLCIAAVPERADASELLLIQQGKVDLGEPLGLASNAVVGTSSARRKNQLSVFRPDVDIRDLRGNVPTRVEKLRQGSYDAILLAKAGVSRLELDLSDLHVEKLDMRNFIPAPAQGALALQVREGEAELRQALEQLNGPDLELVELERSILRSFQGGCQVPLGVHAEQRSDGIHLWTSAAKRSDETPKRVYMKGSDPKDLAERTLVQLKNDSAPSVFISRDLASDSIFAHLLQNNGSIVEGRSLIRTEALAFDGVPTYDRIFFASRNGVQHFMEQYEGPNIESADAIGVGTAKALREYGVEVRFIGDGPDTTDIGKQYAALVKDQKVLFITAEQGSRKVQQGVAAEKRTELAVYRTVQQEGIPAIDAEVLVFTSPSNAEAYFRKNGLKEGQQVVAIGTTTKETLMELGVDEVTIPWASNELALADAVLSS